MSFQMDTQGQRRPYAPPANVIAVLHRIRSRNMPDRIGPDFLGLAGISEGVFGRVMDALRFLGLINEDGLPTDNMRSLAGATDEEYPAILEGIIKAAYREDFERIDPAQDTQAQIVGAFRPYQPRSQTARMVMLLLGLCREAGIEVSDAPRERAMRKSTVRKKLTPKPDKQTESKRPAKPESPAPLGSISSTATLFGVTEDDIGLLPEEEFQALWTALGNVARARAKAKNDREEARQEASQTTTSNGKEGGQI